MSLLGCNDGTSITKNLIKQYPKEDEGCEWKEFKNLKNDFSGHEKDDIISYVSALANMEGRHLVFGVKDYWCPLKVENR